MPIPTLRFGKPPPPMAQDVEWPCFAYFLEKEWFLIVQPDMGLSGGDFEVTIYDMDYKEPQCQTAFNTKEEAIAWAKKIVPILAGNNLECCVNSFCELDH